MPQSVYLARYLNENPEIIPDDFGAGLVVGTNPLDVEDGATGYIEVMWESPSLYMTQVTFRLEHDGISPVRTGDVTAVYADVSYEVSTTGTVRPRPTINNTVPPLGRPAMGFNLEPATWTRELKAMVLPFEQADRNTVDDPSHPWRIASSAGGTFNSTMTSRFTYLRIIVEWEGDPIPTRVYPRADGLGMGAPRIMDSRSPYRSARVFGQI